VPGHEGRDSDPSRFPEKDNKQKISEEFLQEKFCHKKQTSFLSCCADVVLMAALVDSGSESVSANSDSKCQWGGKLIMNCDCRECH
jgi:hypothetical protein